MGGQAAGRAGDGSGIVGGEHDRARGPRAVGGVTTCGSPDVHVNGRPALRAGDRGIHAGCPGSGTFLAEGGAPAVFFDGRCAHRRGDAIRHCGGTGAQLDGSPDVTIGDHGRQPCPAQVRAVGR